MRGLAGILDNFSNSVVFYEWRNFGGAELSFHARKRTLIPSLDSFGFDNSISSFHVPAGMALMAFLDRGWSLTEGNHFYHEESLSSLAAEEANKISSLIILPRITQPYIYSENGFLGKELRLFGGTYTPSDLLDYGRTVIRSIRIPPTWTVELTGPQAPNGIVISGKAAVWNLSRSYPELEAGITKIHVSRSGDRESQPHPLLLGHETGSTRPAQELEAGDYRKVGDHRHGDDLHDGGRLLLFEDLLDKVKIPVGYRVTFYANALLEPPGVALEGEDVDDVAEDLDFPVRSLRIEQVEE